VVYLDVGVLRDLLDHVFFLVFGVQFDPGGSGGRLGHGRLAGAELEGKPGVDFHAHLRQQLLQEAVRVFVDLSGGGFLHFSLERRRGA